MLDHLALRLDQQPFAVPFCSMQHATDNTAQQTNDAKQPTTCSMQQAMCDMHYSRSPAYETRQR
jgi:hypothetical protein